MKDSNPPTPMNFANKAQQAAGLFISAEQYLHLEGISELAIQVAADTSGKDITAESTPTTSNTAEFERLVQAARGPYEQYGKDDTTDVTAVRALMDWAKAHGASNPPRFLARLAAQLDWD